MELIKAVWDTAVFAVYCVYDVFAFIVHLIASIWDSISWIF